MQLTKEQDDLLKQFVKMLHRNISKAEYGTFKNINRLIVALYSVTDKYC